LFLFLAFNGGRIQEDQTVLLGTIFSRFLDQGKKSSLSCERGVGGTLADDQCLSSAGALSACDPDEGGS